jgi:hypothetical protein
MQEVAEAPTISLKEKSVGKDNLEGFTHARYIMQQTRSLVHRFGEQDKASINISETAIEHLNHFIPDREVRRVGQVKLTLGYKPSVSGETSTLRLIDGDQIYDLEINSNQKDSFVIKTPDGSGLAFEHGFDLEDENFINTLQNVRRLLNIVLKDQLGQPKHDNKPSRIKTLIRRWIPGNRN